MLTLFFNKHTKNSKKEASPMIKNTLLAITILFSTQIISHEWSDHRPDAHAPIGVMGDHTHKKGEGMISYRYKTMSMSGIRSGQTKQNISDILNQYMMAPSKMDMNMHMLGTMFAPSNKVTFMAMVPYLNKSMTMQKQDLSKVNQSVSGLSDITISAITTIFKKESHSFYLNSGVSIPIGSINETSDQNSRLPYGMQLGSGTYDLKLSPTYVKQTPQWSLGTQMNGIIRLGKNANDYRLGNVYSSEIWVSRVLSDSVSTSIRSNISFIENIHGKDPMLNTMSAPTTQTSQGSKSMDIAFGINYYATSGFLSGKRLGIELGSPMIQSLNGSQLEREWWCVVGIQVIP